MAAMSISRTRLNLQMALGNFPSDRISGCCLPHRLHFKFPGVSGMLPPGPGYATSALPAALSVRVQTFSKRNTAFHRSLPAIRKAVL